MKRWAGRTLNSPIGRSHGVGTGSVFIAGAISIALSIIGWRLTAASEDRAFVLEYAQRADSEATLLQNSVSNYLDKLYAVRAFFDSSDHPISRDEFEEFGRALLVKNPAILNIAWIARVKRDQRADHEQAAARDGLANYHIKTVGPNDSLPISPEQSEYFPKFYSTEERTSLAYGLDLSSESSRRRTLAHVRDADVLSISPPLVLHIGNGDRHGFWAILPVYARGGPHETAEQRRDNLLGYVQGVFQIGVFVDSIIANVKSPTNLYFFAADAKPNDPPFYFTSHLVTGAIRAKSQGDLAAVLHRTVPLTLGDVHWTLVLTLEDTDLTSNRHQGSLILLISGLLLSTILTAFLWQMRRGSRLVQDANNKLHQQKVVLDTALENMSQGLCLFDGHGGIRLFNERFAKMMGVAPDALQGRALLDLLRQRQAQGDFSGDPEAFSARLIETVREGQSVTSILDTAGGSSFRVINQPMAQDGWVSTVEDITESRKAQSLITHLAHHDALTDLANRTLLIERLKDDLAELETDRSKLAVHFIDLDRFKDVNDTMGHDGGDLLLKTVAARLRSVAGPEDVVARLGGDEFVVVQARVCEQQQADQLAHRLLSAVTAPIKLGKQTVVPTISIGVAMAPRDGADPAQLFKSADLALYKAKADGRNCVRFFAATMGTDLQTRFWLEKLIRDAVRDENFVLHYQPIVEVGSGRLVGFEALIRLLADGRVIPPSEIIPLAEEMRLIDKIGAWALEEACRTAANWPETLSVAVNLSPAQFTLGHVTGTVSRALANTGLAAHRLELEITEALMLGDTKAILTELESLHAMGVTIVMDDFGTGYSSLSYLCRFPFDKIKIDRSFLRDFDGASHDAATVVKAIIALGHQLRMKVVAEGVESATQLALLHKHNCDQAQGFFFSEPVPAAELGAVLLKSFTATLPVPRLQSKARASGAGA
jgi:diguanylate cyclase (GGDEF)-like protein/PAS domain S-box-containing protein